MEELSKYEIEKHVNKILYETRSVRVLFFFLYAYKLMK